MAKKTADPETEEAADGFTADERAAMKERAAELKTTKRRGKNTREDGERDLLAKLAEMPDPDRIIGERLHALISAAAPGLDPKTWYGMPAYARDGKVVCFFQAAAKFGARYGTLGFNDSALLDDGEMWPTAFAITELTPEVEARVSALVTKAAG